MNNFCIFVLIIFWHYSNYSNVSNIVFCRLIMADHKKYLEKVVIHSGDTIVGEYRPLIDDKRNCQIISLTNNFKDVDIGTWASKTKKHPTFSPKKASKHKKQKLTTIELRNSELRLLRSQRFDEYVLFFTQKTSTNEVLHLKLSKRNKSRKRHKPINYLTTVGVGNIFEERVKKELKYWVLNYPDISANAIYRTESKDRPKMFLSQDVKTDCEIDNFLINMKKFNYNCKKIVNHGLPIKNVKAFVVINKNRRDLYLELTNGIKKCLNKNLQGSKCVDFDKKKYVDAGLLNLKIKYLKWYKINNNKQLLVDKSSLVSINEYTIENMYDLIQEYEDNITSTQNMLNNESLDDVMKDTYKVLVELQLNAVQQCNQLFLNYFAYKNQWSQQKVTIFNEYIKQNFNLLLKLQNRAIENSVFVNKRIKKVNKFLNKIRNETLLRCMPNSQRNLTSSVSATNRICKITSISDNARQEYEFKVSVSEFDADETCSVANGITINKKETEVQTSTIQIEKIVERSLQINRCCSPIDVSVPFDKKCVQTDISVNKNTSFDFDGKQIQICKKNISLRMRSSVHKKNKSQPVLPTVEKEIDQNKNKSLFDLPPKQTEQANLEQKIPEDIKQEQIINLVTPSEKEILNKLIEYKEIKTKKQEVITNQQNIPNSPVNNETKNLEASITQENDSKNHILHKIQNTLDVVKQRFEKNSQILREVTDLRKSYFVTSNIQNLMETGGIKGDFPGKPKFIKIAPEIKNTLSTSLFKTKEAIASNLNTSLQLLKNLNNVTQNLKTNQGSAFGALNELEESIILQKKYMPKLKLDKMQLTLTPIKNFIETNKKVLSGTGRYSIKKSSITPCINSKYIVDLNKNKSRCRRRPKPSTANIPNVQTTHETTNVPKIFRPVNSNPMPETPKLSELSLTDVTPLQPEYPRKDNLNHIEIEKSYLYKLLNNSFSEKNLEPTIQCSNANCASCTIISDDKQMKSKKDGRESRRGSKRREAVDSKQERREFFKKIAANKNKSLVWEKMDWNTEITVQPDHDFDFNQFMDDPAFKNAQNLTVCPVSVNFERQNNQRNLEPKSFEASLRNFNNVVKKGPNFGPIRHPNQASKNIVTEVEGEEFNNSTISNSITSMKKVYFDQNGIKSITSMNKNPNDANKIQQSIQNALIKNQEKYKFIQHTPQKTLKHRNIPVMTPKIVSSGTLHKQKVTNAARMAHAAIPSRRTEFVQRRPTVVAYKEDNVFDRKYKMAKVAVSKTSATEDTILNSISKTVKKSQDDMQRYIELVEQKFLKTFSLPETEKASAYTNLESEIKEMLNLLNAKKGKNAKPEDVIAELTNLKRPKTPAKNKIIVLKEPNNDLTTSEMAVDKKKNSDNSRPTICTDSIIFSESLAAIVSKQSIILPPPQKSSSILKNSVSNLKNSFSAKSVNKKVRFKLDETKITRSDSTFTISTDDYSTFCEETLSEFSSDQEFKINHPSFDVSILLYNKLIYYVSFPILTANIYYVITYYQFINIKTSNDSFEPENYDVKILCKNNAYLLKKPSSFGFDDLKPILSTASRDSLSDFIENCEEIIEATKKLDLERQKSSPYILEFLDVLSSISLENVVLKIEIYFQTSYFRANLEYFPQIYCIIKYYNPIFYRNSSIEKFAEIYERCRQEMTDVFSIDSSEYINYYKNIDNEIDTKLNQDNSEIADKDTQTTVSTDIFKKFANDLGQISNELGTLFTEIKTDTSTKPNLKIIPYNTETNPFVQFKNKNIHQHFSQITFDENYRLKFPFDQDIMKCNSDTVCMGLVTYTQKQRYETIGQTLILNLQITNYGRNTLRQNTRKSIRKKCYIPPMKNKVKLKAIEMNFDLNTVKLLAADRPHKMFLIVLYIAFFSVAFLCMTLNYKCE